MTNPNDIPERDAAAPPPRLPSDAIEEPLGRLDHYEIADGYPDIRGWELYGSDGHQLGCVTELLADPGSRRVTQAVVDVDGRRTTVPIEFIHLDEAASRAFVSDEGVERTSLRQASRGAGSNELDIGIRRRSESAPAQRDAERGREAVDTPSSLEGNDQLRASLQRDLAPGQSMGTPIFRDGEIRVPIIEEEIIIEKRPVVKEELVIRTNTVTEERTIHADVRKERVDVERTDDRSRDGRDIQNEPRERH